MKKLIKHSKIKKSAIKNKDAESREDCIRVHIVKFRCSVGEKSQIKTHSAQCNLSMAQFVRQLALGFKPQSLDKLEERMSLRNQAADLGRLGGLLKLLLTDTKKATEVGITEIKSLLKQIEESKNLLNQLALRI